MDLGNRAEKLMDARVTTLDKFEPTSERYQQLRKFAL